MANPDVQAYDVLTQIFFNNYTEIQRKLRGLKAMQHAMKPMYERLQADAIPRYRRFRNPCTGYERMSKPEFAVECDGDDCEKRTWDFIKDGWLVIACGTGFVEYTGRCEGFGAEESKRAIQIDGAAKHFCSWFCFVGRPLTIKAPKRTGT